MADLGGSGKDAATDGHRTPVDRRAATTLGRDTPMTRKRRQVLIGICAALLLVVSGVVAVNLLGERESDEGIEAGEFPPLMSRHMEALPENGGLEGPAGSADEALLERAVPAHSLSAAHVDGAQAAVPPPV